MLGDRERQVCQPQPDSTEQTSTCAFLTLCVCPFKLKDTLMFSFFSPLCKPVQVNVRVLHMKTPSILQAGIDPFLLCPSGSCFRYRKTIYSCMWDVALLNRIASGCWEPLQEGCCPGYPLWALTHAANAGTTLGRYCEGKHTNTQGTSLEKSNA